METSLAVILPPREIQKRLEDEGGQFAEAALRTLNAYIESACRPLLSLSEDRRLRLSEDVVRLFAGSQPAHERLGAALYEIYGRRPWALAALAEVLNGQLERFRDLSKGLFREDFIGCFEMGTRVYASSIKLLAKLAERKVLQQELPREKLEYWLSSYLSVGCLDLAHMTVWLYLDEARDPRKSAIPEELCYLVKKYAIEHAGFLRTMLLPDRKKVSESTDIALLSPEDSASDRSFANMALYALRTAMRQA